MASSVAAPLERQFGQIPGISQMTSLSTLGATQSSSSSTSTAISTPPAQDVQAAITVAKQDLAAELTAPPTYKKVNPADAPILILSASTTRCR